MEIFLKFLPPAFVTRIAQDIPSSKHTYGNGRFLRLFLRKIYSILAVKVRIYGGESVNVGVKLRTRPLGLQIQQFKRYFEDNSLQKMVGVTGSDIFLAQFLNDSTYTKELSNNFVEIVRLIGTYIAGDKKLFRFLWRVTMFSLFLASRIEWDCGSMS